MHTRAVLCVVLLHTTLVVVQGHRKFYSRQMRAINRKIENDVKAAKDAIKEDLMVELTRVIHATGLHEEIGTFKDQLAIQKVKRKSLERELRNLILKLEILEKRVSKQTCPRQDREISSATSTSMRSRQQGRYKRDVTTPGALPVIADIGGCRIRLNDRSARGTPSVGGNPPSPTHVTTSCYNQSASTRSKEVHVLASYHSQKTVQTDGIASETRASVDFEGSTPKPVVLVLSSHLPVSWDVLVPPGLLLEQIYLITYHQKDSSVTVPGNLNLKPVIIHNEAPNGSNKGNTSYDDDDDIVNLLKLLQQRLGYVTSYSGTKEADHWKLRVGA